MANQLAMDKSFAINNLRTAGYSERRIAETLGVSRGAVRRHLHRREPNSTEAPPALVGQAPTGSDDPNSTTAPTGSGDEKPVAETAVSPPANGSTMRSQPAGGLSLVVLVGVTARKRIDEAIAVRGDIGLPRAQQTDRSALALLARLGLPSDRAWEDDSSPLMHDVLRSYGGKGGRQLLKSWLGQVETLKKRARKGQGTGQDSARDFNRPAGRTVAGWPEHACRVDHPRGSAHVSRRGSPGLVDGPILETPHSRNAPQTLQVTAPARQPRSHRHVDGT